MSAIASTPINGEAKNAPTSGRLFFLDLSGGRILSANPDGSDLKTIINEGRRLPDGIALDVAAGHIYWSNMGEPERNDGSIMRSDLDGKNMITLVPPGGTFTPKQLQLEKRSGKLYWSDREGMRVMRANLDGSEIETLVDTSLGDSRPGLDPRKWCVGIAVDPDGGKFYWTQKGGHDAGLGRIFRANIQVPQGQSADNRRDLELLYDNLPEPIDLDLDPVHRTLYWTDRGDPPRGNTVNRAPMDPQAEDGKEPEILVNHLMEGIGLALDFKGDRMFITDFGGSVYSANLDGSNRTKLLIAEGNLTGIAYAEVASMVFDTLAVRKEGAALFVKIAAPPMNLLGPELVRDLGSLLQQAEAEQSIRVLVFKSADRDYFISHVDLTRIKELKEATAELDEESLGLVLRRLSTSRLVTIAQIEGRVRGVGSEFALACDMRFAARESAIFGQFEPSLGVIPGAGAVQHLTRLMGRARALEVMLSAGDYNADLAEHYGWINRALPAAELGEFVRSLALRIASFPDAGHVAIKDRVNAIALAPAGDFRRDAEVFGAGLRDPEAQDLIQTAMKRGLQTRDAEMDLARMLGGLTVTQT